MCRRCCWRVHGGAEYHAAALQHIFRNGGKRAAGGGVFSDGVVPVPGGKGSGQMRRRLLLLQNGADPRCSVRSGRIAPDPRSENQSPSWSRTMAMASVGTACWRRRYSRCSGSGPPASAQSFAAPRRLLPPVQGRFSSAACKIAQGRPAGRWPAPLLRGIPVDRTTVSSAVSPLPMTRSGKAETAENRLTVRERSGAASSAGDTVVKKGLVELNGKHRSVEGIGAPHSWRFGTDPETLPGRHPESAAGLGMNLLADAAQLHHRQARLLPPDCAI